MQDLVTTAGTGEGKIRVRKQKPPKNLNQPTQAGAKGMRKNTDKCKPFILLNKGLQGQCVSLVSTDISVHNRTNTADELQSKQGQVSSRNTKGECQVSWKRACTVGPECWGNDWFSGGDKGVKSLGCVTGTEITVRLRRRGKGLRLPGSETKGQGFRGPIEKS